MEEARQEDELSLWRQYKKKRDIAIRDKLIIKYAPFVKYIAGRIAMKLPSSVELDDLIGYGIFGLIDAIEKFDTDKKVKFKTYAQTRITGAILDELRNIDWAPRSVRQNAKKLEKAFHHLENTLGRAVTDQEVAQYLNISMEELNELYNQAKSALIFSLDELKPQEDDSGVSLINLISNAKTADPESEAEKIEFKKNLVEALESLSERERQVLTLYYYEELTLKEIGDVLGVSDSRVSQLHTKAILRLRAKLNKIR